MFISSMNIYTLFLKVWDFILWYGFILHSHTSRPYILTICPQRYSMYPEVLQCVRTSAISFSYLICCWSPPLPSHLAISSVADQPPHPQMWSYCCCHKPYLVAHMTFDNVLCQSVLSILQSFLWFPSFFLHNLVGAKMYNVHRKQGSMKTL